MINQIKSQLCQTFPNDLVEKILESYILLKNHYYLGNYRPASLEGGRFAEVGLRILQHIILGKYTSLDDRLPNFHDEIVKFGNTPGFSDTIRFHIPRILEIIHDIRNKRDVGHPKGELDANYSDATLSLYGSSWVLVELMRLYYTADINEAQKLLNELIRFQVPIIQDFNGFLKILDPTMALWEKIMIWALYRKSEGVTLDEIRTWTKEKHENWYIRKVLNNLENDKGFLHSVGDRYFITNTGMLEVSRKIPLAIRNK